MRRAEITTELDMQTEEMRLDGNAAGGALRDVYVRDVTAALATCAGCGSVAAVGALLEYGHGMGVILRCPRCDAPMLRGARMPGRVSVDASGLALLVIPKGVAV
jgi:Family of unknown function (DUF6510)